VVDHHPIAGLRVIRTYAWTNFRYNAARLVTTNDWSGRRGAKTT
jgi:hypothetical protein